MKKGLVFIFIYFPIPLFAQIIIVSDTIQSQGDSIVVSATRSERKLSNVTVPVTILNAKIIQQIGALRLSDILKEQPGLTMTSGFGTGVQLQGLNPDYTIILINGAPLVGRTAGVLDLNRIALGNIKKIEIIKGPSSSLYGSEAMAGVINIITDVATNIPLQTTIRYGTNNTIDAGMNNALASKSIFYQGYYNYYSTDGYSIRPNSAARVTTPISRFATNQQLKFNVKDNTQILLHTRLTREEIKNDITVINGGVSIQSNGEEKNTDYNIATTLNHRFSNNMKTSFRSYITEYNATQNLVTISGTPYTDILNHNFNRIENQTDWALGKNIISIFGGGFVVEGVKSSRYESEKVRKTNAIQYAFSQWEWSPNSKLIIIGGIRFDHNQTYASAISPKGSMLYKFNNQNKIRFSIGQGFKAPDFRQLYLDFTNAAAGAYSVFGTVQAQKVIGQLNTLGQIGTLYNNYYLLKSLQPEFSTGLHFSWEFEPNTKSFLSIQFFKNDIRNLIEVQQVGAYITGSQIYSYLNIGRAFTSGAELEMRQQISNKVSLSAAYQYLKTGDKDQIAQIKSGTVYTRDNNGISKRLDINEYSGLPNNSKHKIQLKLNYNNTNGIFGNFRALYRSKWAINNTNGNEVFDEGDSFAKGYVAFNTGVGKDFVKGLGIQFGCDNILNYTDALNLPNLLGRTFYTTIKFQIKTKHKI